MFSLRLKQLREEAGYSQKTFGQTFGVGQSTVGNWEAGKREPNFETLRRLADFFGVSTDYLLGLDSNPTLLPLTVAAHTEAPLTPELDARIREIVQEAIKKYANKEAPK